MAEPEQDLRLGTVLQDRYKILARIAAGGMGTVYRGERVGLGRRVAIKFLHATFATDKEFLRRFEVEARAMSRLSHPHCVSVIDFGVADAPYMVLDFADGETLRALLDRGSVEPRRALSIVRQVLAGLQHAHAQGIVHRDVKPANIVLDDHAGTGEHARLLDFGLAKLHDHGGSSQDHSLGSIAVGTPGYMSPEQVRGDRVDGRADVYATGLLLYELITGQRMFSADEAWQVLKMHLEQAPSRIKDTRPDLAVSPELEAAIARSLAKKADDRFQSAAEFAGALDATPEGALLPRTSRSGAVPAVPVASVASVPRAVPPIVTDPIDDSASLAILAKASTVAMPIARADTPTPVALLSREKHQAEDSVDRPARGPGLARAVGVLMLLAAIGSGVWWWSQRTPSPPRTAAAPRPSAPAPTALGRTEPTPAPGLIPPTAPPDALAVAGMADAGVADGAAGADVDANETDAGPAEAIPPEEQAEPVAPVPEAIVPEEAIDPAPVPPVAVPAPRPAITRVEDVTPLIDAGRNEEAITALLELRRKQPKNAYVPYLIGNLYFDKKWWTDGIDYYKTAIALNRGYRSRGILIRNVIRALDSAKTRGRAIALIRGTIGNAALPELRRAAKSDKSPVVRANAAALVKQMTTTTRPRSRF